MEKENPILDPFIGWILHNPFKRFWWIIIFAVFWGAYNFFKIINIGNNFLIQGLITGFLSMLGALIGGFVFIFLYFFFKVHKN